MCLCACALQKLFSISFLDSNSFAVSFSKRHPKPSTTSSLDLFPSIKLTSQSSLLFLCYFNFISFTFTQHGYRNSFMNYDGILYTLCCDWCRRRVVHLILKILSLWLVKECFLGKKRFAWVSCPVYSCTKCQVCVVMNLCWGIFVMSIFIKIAMRWVFYWYMVLIVFHFVNYW